MRCCLTLAGIALGSDLPDEIIDHPAFHIMHIAATDMVWWANVSRAHLMASRPC